MFLEKAKKEKDNVKVTENNKLILSLESAEVDCSYLSAGIFFDHNDMR